MAIVVDRSRISARFPGNRRVVVMAAPSRIFTQKHTVPTGLASVPPPVPALAQL